MPIFILALVVILLIWLVMTGRLRDVVKGGIAAVAMSA